MKCVLCVRRVSARLRRDLQRQPTADEVLARVRDSETHVCVGCAADLQVQIADIARLAVDASAYVLPGSTTGGGGRTVPSSRPPLCVDAVDVELTPVPMFPGEVDPEPLLNKLERWERLVREMRQMAPYGPASAARAAQIALDGDLRHRGRVFVPFGGNDTRVTLVGVVTFLGRSVAWMTTEADFPVDDFADEVRACVRVLRRWDMAAEERGQMVPCPTVGDDGRDCGHRIGFRVHLDEQVTCRRCGVTRDVPQLLMAADADNALVDAEALAQQFAIDTSTIRKWARAGKVERQGQRYRYGDVRACVVSMRGRNVGRLM